MVGAFHEVVNDGNKVRVRHVTATATGGTRSQGVFNNSSSPTIRNSSITSDSTSINSVATLPKAKVANTMLDGPVAGTEFACVGVHNAAFVALGIACV